MDHDVKSGENHESKPWQAGRQAGMRPAYVTSWAGWVRVRASEFTRGRKGDFDCIVTQGEGLIDWLIGGQDRRFWGGRMRWNVREDLIKRPRVSVSRRRRRGEELGDLREP